jgi:hypothetical protein
MRWLTAVDIIGVRGEKRRYAQLRSVAGVRWRNAAVQGDPSSFFASKVF